MFVKDGIISKTTEDFPLSKLSSIQSSSMLTGTVVVFASGHKTEIKGVFKADGKEIVDLIRARLSDQSHTVATNSTLSSTVADPMEQIRKLGELRTTGVLNEDEFNVKKAEILSRM